MKHLRFDCIDVHSAGVKGHPQEIMRELGITYTHATQNSIADCWLFWNCENIPDPLPKYLEESKANPLNMVGFGLSRKEAEEIVNYKK